MSKFSVQLSSSEVADPCVGVEFSIAKLAPSAPGGLAAGTYTVQGVISIDGEPSTSRAHNFPPANGPFSAQVTLDDNTPSSVKLSIPFNDQRYGSYDNNQTAHLTVSLVDSNDNSHVISQNHSLQTRVNFSPGSFSTCSGND